MTTPVSSKSSVPFMERLDSMIEACMTNDVDKFLSSYENEPYISPNFPIRGSKYMINVACQHGSSGIVDILVEKGVTINLGAEQCAFSAYQNGHSEITLKILQDRKLLYQIASLDIDSIRKIRDLAHDIIGLKTEDNHDQIRNVDTNILHICDSTLLERGYAKEQIISSEEHINEKNEESKQLEKVDFMKSEQACGENPEQTALNKSRNGNEKNPKTTQFSITNKDLDGAYGKQVEKEDGHNLDTDISKDDLDVVVSFFKYVGVDFPSIVSLETLLQTVGGHYGVELKDMKSLYEFAENQISIPSKVDPYTSQIQSKGSDGIQETPYKIDSVPEFDLQAILASFLRSEGVALQSNASIKEMLAVIKEKYDITFDNFDQLSSFFEIRNCHQSQIKFNSGQLSSSSEKVVTQGNSLDCLLTLYKNKKYEESLIFLKTYSPAEAQKLLNQGDLEGETLFHKIVNDDNTDFLRKLLQHHQVYAITENKNGQLPVEVAIQKGNHHISSFLLFGNMPFREVKDGLAPVFNKKSQDYFSIFAKKFLENNRQNSSKRTSLDYKHMIMDIAMKFHSLTQFSSDMDFREDITELIEEAYWSFMNEEVE